MRSAVETMKRITFELGGKSPNIVFDDADLDAAVDGALLGIYLNQGQCCCAGSRLFVQESVHDEFVEKLAAKVRARRLGDPFDPATEQGPQVDRAQFDKILSYIAKGKEQGARVVTGGERHGDKGFFIKPTIFADVRDDMAIASDEIFGPVLSVIKFKDVEEAIHRGQHHRLRPGRRRLDPRHRQGPRRSPTASGPAPSGSTATTSSTPPPPSAASSSPGSAASWARRPSTTTPR